MGRFWGGNERKTLKRLAGTKTAEEIGMILDRTPNAILQMAGKISVSLKKVNENHSGTKMSNLQVEIVRALYEGGFTVLEIHAACFDHVGFSTVKDIVAMRTRTTPVAHPDRVPLKLLP